MRLRYMTTQQYVLSPENGSLSRCVLHVREEILFGGWGGGSLERREGILNGISQFKLTIIRRKITVCSYNSNDASAATSKEINPTTRPHYGKRCTIVSEGRIDHGEITLRDDKPWRHYKLLRRYITHMYPHMHIISRTTLKTHTMRRVQCICGTPFGTTVGGHHILPCFRGGPIFFLVLWAFIFFLVGMLPFKRFLDGLRGRSPCAVASSLF